MSDKLDTVGDLLRRFYAFYGTSGEGPRTDDDVSQLLGSAHMPQEQLELLQSVLTNKRSCEHFLRCREILENLANRLTGDELLREISSLEPASNTEFARLSNGIFWFGLAASLDKRVGGMPELPPEFDALNLPISLKANMVVVGSLVLRLYLALVYMRGGALEDLINRGAKNQNPCCLQVRKLLNSDYIRRIRNALSHGTFSSSIAGLTFEDDKGVLIGTPGFLNRLCIWINLIQLQVLVACSQRDRVA